MPAYYRSEAELEKDLMGVLSPHGQKSKHALIRKGLALTAPHQHVSRTVALNQVALKGYGRCDILLYEVGTWNGVRQISLDLIELKNEPITIEHLSQAQRYTTGLKKALDSLKSLSSRKIHVLARIHLIGTSLTEFQTSDHFYTALNLHICHLYEFQVSPASGLRFTHISHLREPNTCEPNILINSLSTQLLRDLKTENHVLRGFAEFSNNRSLNNN